MRSEATPAPGRRTGEIRARNLLRIESPPAELLEVAAVEETAVPDEADDSGAAVHIDGQPSGVAVRQRFADRGRTAAAVGQIKSDSPVRQKLDPLAAAVRPGVVEERSAANASSSKRSA